MNLNNPVISVVMPAYNSEKFISNSIDSVLKQSFASWELLIIDGGSNDNTLKIVESYSSRFHNIKLINNENDQGPAHARSLGLKKGTGEYFAFIDADDTWLEDKLSKQYLFMIKNNYFFSYTSYKLLSRDGKISNNKIPTHLSNTYKQYLGRRGIANSTVIIHKKCIVEDLYNSITSYHGEDTLWWLIIMREGFNSYLFDEPLTIYRDVEGSLSTKFFKHQVSVWYLYRRSLKIKFLKSLFYYFLYLSDVLRRRINFKIASLFN
jgi:teichuronic acid biosynthesis glycosyltransferase TuaG